eukprot:scaffold55034_cov46-Prasinocladus_malaysianus.AAC.1
MSTFSHGLPPLIVNELLQGLWRTYHVGVGVCMSESPFDDPTSTESQPFRMSKGTGALTLPCTECTSPRHPISRSFEVYAAPSAASIRPNASRHKDLQIAD